MKNPALIFASLAVTGALVLSACSPAQNDAASNESSTSVATQDVSDTSASADSTAAVDEEVTYADLDIKEMSLDVDLSSAVEVTLADGASAPAAGVTVDSDTVTINSGGTYRLSGSLSAGSIVVNAPDEDVTVVLDGVDVTAAGLGAFNVIDAKNVVLYLADGTQNSLSDAEGASIDESDDDAPNAAVYSTADLWIAGSGTLAVSGVNDGITSKDSLIIAGGDIEVTAVDDGVRGKDHLVIRDGSLAVDAGGDALKSDNDGKTDDPDAIVGVIWIEGGEINLAAGSDAADATRQVTINGGALTIAAGDDGLHSDGVLRIDGGTVNISESYEGIEGAFMYLSGGDVVVVASDDGINVAGGSTSTVAATQGDEETRGGPGGIGDGQMPTDGTRPERPEGAPDMGDMPGGAAGGGNAGAGRGQFAESTVASDLSSVTVTSLEDGGFGGPAEGSNGDRHLEVSGGTFVINTDSDGVDVNGSMTMTGGTVVVTATTDNAQGAMDVDDTFTMSGGTLAASGMAAMAVAPESTGNQGVLPLVFSEALPAGAVITITDSSGVHVESFATAKVSQSLVFSSDEVVAGDAYTVTLGGSTTGSSIGDLVVNGEVTGGDDVGTVTAQ